MDSGLQAAMEEFILQRINAQGANEPEPLQAAVSELRATTAKLNSSLSADQQAFYRECENVYALVDGEMMQCYYRAGFSDAVAFLFAWRNGKWN